MRLGVKSMLAMLAGYAILIAAFGLGIDRWLHGFEDTVVVESLKVLAQEKAALLSERALAALETPGPEPRGLLKDRLDDLVLVSAMTSSIAVVDAEGSVVAGDRRQAGEKFPRAGEVFARDRDVKVTPLRSPRFLHGREYEIRVPLASGSRLLGYAQVEFPAESVDAVFAGARRQLYVAAVLGLVGVVLLGAAMQFQISRRTEAVAQSLEGAIDGPARPARPDRGDEFSRVARAAGRVREALGEARRERSRLQESFNALAQAMDMGVLLLRDRRAPHFANPRALELFGVSSLEALRERWPAVHSRLEPYFGPLLDGEAASPPARVEIPGEGVASLRVEIFRMGGGDCDEFLLLMNDPEILAALESDVRLASQLQGVARVYRTVAHELRAPLSAMMIHLDLLRESLGRPSAGGEAKESQERYVRVLRDELDRLNRSLTETLTETLPPSDPQDFDLRDALRELGTLLAPQARRQGVDLRTEMPETPVMIVGYKDRLKQSFLNIAVNALEALPSGGKVSMKMSLHESGVRVRITDDGEGIPKDVLDQIYERDFTTKGKGNGIGLYVARSLVQLHGGEIHAESAPGTGTSVEVRLPVVTRS